MKSKDKEFTLVTDFEKYVYGENNIKNLCQNIILIQDVSNPLGKLNYAERFLDKTVTTLF